MNSVRLRGMIYMETMCLKSEDISKTGQGRIRRNLFAAFADACRTNGKAKKIITDGDGKVFTYAEIMRAAFALSSPLKKHSQRNEAVGILLPTCLLYTSPSPRD